jgi:PAS domain S-box-containing protein
VFWVTDGTRSRVEYISPGFERVWGKACRELYDSPGVWVERIHPEDRQRILRAMFTRQMYGDYDEEYRVIRPDKALRWVHDRAFPVKDGNGAVYRIVGIAEDITERKRAEQLLQAERDLGTALSATSNSKFAAERVLDAAMKLEAIDCGGVYLMNQETGELHLAAHRGLTSDFIERFSLYKANATETRLARAGRATYVNHEQIPRSLEVLWGSHGLRALAVVPFKHKGAVLGMIILASFGENQIPAQVRLGVELIGSQVSAAFARIEAEESVRRNMTERFRLEKQILEISDREQARIGQDVHDGLCQQLVGAAFAANSLEQNLAGQDSPEAKQAQRICALLDEAMTESRRVARGLYPLRLKTEGLGPALVELARTMTERFGFQCVCEQPPETVQCDLTTATHLYRIAQEALNNAMKHSGARNFSIRLSTREGALDLEIQDNGKGFDRSPRSCSGMGLHIMDYRARSLGGELRIQSDKQGTLISCHIPQLFSDSKPPIE